MELPQEQCAEISYPCAVEPVYLTV